MPGLKLNIFIFNCENNELENFECPRENGPRNCEDIIEWCKNLLEEKILVKMEKQDNGNWSINFPARKYIKGDLMNLTLIDNYFVESFFF